MKDPKALNITLIDVFKKYNNYFNNLDYKNNIEILEMVEIYYIDNFFP